MHKYVIISIVIYKTILPCSPPKFGVIVHPFQNSHLPSTATYLSPRLMAFVERFDCILVL